MIAVGLYIHMCLIAIFAVSFLTKCFKLKPFFATIAELGFGSASSRIIGVCIVALECAAVICLLTSRLFAAGAVIVFVLAFSFAGAAIIAFSTKKNVVCSCFGDLLPEQLGKSTLYKALAIVALNISLVWISAVSGARIGSHTWSDMLLASLGALAALVAYAVLQSMAVYFRNTQPGKR